MHFSFNKHLRGYRADEVLSTGFSSVVGLSLAGFFRFVCAFVPVCVRVKIIIIDYRGSWARSLKLFTHIHNNRLCLLSILVWVTFTDVALCFNGLPMLSMANSGKYSALSSTYRVNWWPDHPSVLFTATHRSPSHTAPYWSLTVLQCTLKVKVKI